MLRFENVEARQGDFALAADFAVAARGITAVIGPSGAGKSTLLSLAAGFLDPNRGRILMADADVTGVPPSARPVSIVFQDGNLFPHMSVAANVALGVSPNGRLTPWVQSNVADVLARVGLEGFGPRRPAELSGGQQSRAALARALLRKRPLVLLDEPFSALGPALRAEMLDLVADVFSDVTVLMVTHAPEDAARVAEQIIFVDGGQAHPPQDTQAVFEDPPDAMRAYLG